MTVEVNKWLKISSGLKYTMQLRTVNSFLLGLRALDLLKQRISIIDIGQGSRYVSGIHRYSNALFLLKVSFFSKPIKYLPHKMVKHTQTIRRQIA